MSRWGIGPIFAVLSMSYGAIMLAASDCFYPVFQMNQLPYRFLVPAGILLLVVGVPFWLASAVAVMRAYNADQLVTSGLFRCCRHPLYASWVVFIVPGIMLLANSWPGLTTPIFMYFVLRRLVRKEEIYLENTFGDYYRQYKATVPCILPYGWLTS